VRTIIDDAKEYLNKVRYIDNEIDAKEEIKARMRERLVNIKATQHREIDVQGGKRKTNEDRILDYIEYAEQINELIDKLINLKMTVVEQIEQIDDGLYRTILTERYVNNRKWDDVAEILGYEDTRPLFRIHNDALREFGKINKFDTKSHVKSVNK
jgi:hypothetical protein